MKNGFRVYDTDTHIDPGADVLERYVDPGFRKRLDDLAPYRVAVKSRTVDGGIRNTYRFEQRLYERTLGEAEARPGTGDGLPFIGMVPEFDNVWIAAGHFRAGIQLSPGTARVLAQSLCGETPIVPIEAFRIDRPIGHPIRPTFRS